MKNSDDAQLWAAAFSQGIADETSNPDELAAAWRGFRRQHVRGFWPTPGAVCQAIRDRRATVIELRPRAEPERLPPPSYVGPERVSMHTRLRTMAALDEARKMVADGNPLGPALVRLGESIIARNGAGEN